MSLFSLFVDLKANTTDFVSGMSNASSSAKRAGHDIEDSFSRLGSIASVALAPFGQLGQQISSTLASIGTSASTASASFAKLGGGMTGIAVGAGAAAGALAAIGAGAIAITVHTAEAASKMLELSRSTGVPVETLSRFSFVAKQAGVDTDVMTTGLERMSKSAFAAATAPAGAINAYTRLGVSVRDLSGNIRPVQDILLDVANKFAAMPDGIQKTALAMQIFGRSGDQLIPILDLGREKIEELEATSDRLGVTLSTKTAVAAEEFHQKLGELEGAADGLALKITLTLLPALTAVVADLAESDQHSGSDFEYYLLWFERIASGSKRAAAAIEKLNGTTKQSPEQQFQQKILYGPAFPIPGNEPKQPTIGGVDGKDTAADLVTNLQAQVQGELALAAAAGQSAAALDLAKAAAEADSKIAQTRTELLDREKSLREQLANALVSEHPEEAPKYQAEISAVQKHLAELQADVPQIRSLYQQMAAVKFSSGIVAELTKTGKEFDNHIAGVQRCLTSAEMGVIGERS